MKKLIMIIVLMSAANSWADAMGKLVRIWPVGPTSGVGLSAYVARYRSAAGLGEGYILPVLDGAQVTSNFCTTVRLTQTQDELRFFASGYKVGQINEWIDLIGNDSAAGARYVYRDETRDSFSYACVVFPEERLTCAIEERDDPWTSEIVLALATSTDSSDAYPVLDCNVIFSKEYLPSDNFGDINSDGVPDVIVQKFWNRIEDKDFDDLQFLMNDDGDFLPIAAMPIYLGAIPSLPTPAHAGREFSARMEIRGFGECLNDALSDHFPDGVQNPCAVANAHSEKIYTNPNEDTKSTLTYLEYLAWLDFSLAKGVDATDERNFSQWSPERPSDPTKADTDEDGIDDGIEYWFWYRAHVGYMDGAIHKYETGRRLNSSSGANGEKIASTEIEKIMDPVVANKSWASDTDGDGLGDSVELQINTNPFDFDTDDDGLPDGYEICVTKTDPLSALTLDEESGRMVKDYDCFVAVGTTNDYSGQSYSITVVNRKTGGGCPWTVYYAEAENGPYTTEKPNYCKVGVYTNWCYVSAIDGSVSFRGATQMAVVDVREVPIAGSEVVDGRTWTYRIYKGMATAVSVNPANGLVQIPLTLGGFSVVSIGEGAFENCRDLTAVMIPASVQRIGSCAFSGCEALKDVYFLGDCPMSDGAVFEGCCPVPHVVLLSNISKETVDNAEPHVIMSVAGQDLSMDVYGAVCRYVGVELRKPIVPDVLSPANVKSIEIKNGKAKLGIQIEMTSSLECPNWKPVDVTPETLEIQLPTELQGFIRLQSK